MAKLISQRSLIVVVVLAALGISTGSWADYPPPDEYYVCVFHNDGYANLQVQGNTVYATAEDRWWIEGWDPNTREPYYWDPIWNIEVRYELKVDGRTVQLAAPLAEEAYGPPIISRNQFFPDVIPISWEHQLTPGNHTVEFICDYAAWDEMGQWMPYIYFEGFHFTTVVTVP